MFETSDEFYQSLGLPENSMSYDETKAMIQKPEDGRVVVCHASAWDFCDKQDFRYEEHELSYEYIIHIVFLLLGTNNSQSLQIYNFYWVC